MENLLVTSDGEDDLLKGSNSDLLDGSDQETEHDDRRHAKMLDAIEAIGGKNRHRLSQRTIPAAQVSEFGFGSSRAGSKLSVSDLVGSLKGATKKHTKLKVQLQQVNKQNKIVAVPLPKREQERLQRSIAYEKTSQEVSKWDSVIEQNRKAEQLIFPLQQPSVMIQTTSAYTKGYKLRTPLEKEVAALLNKSSSVETKSNMLTKSEERALKAMSLQEAKERRAELQKYRALLSYKEAKARRQNKIKSKRYHRVLKKERLKIEKKGLEELQKKDPDGYVEKLEKLEKDRIKERMSLKHRGGSKFAKKQLVYGKYDDRGRQAVQDMIQKNKDLTQKIHVDSDSDESGVSMDSEDEIKMDRHHLGTRGDNPWMTIRTQKTKYEKPKPVINTEVLKEGDSVLLKEDGIDVAVEKVGSKRKKKAEFQKSEKTDSVGKNDDQIDRIFEKLDRHSAAKKMKMSDSQTNIPEKSPKKKRRRLRRKKKNKKEEKLAEKDEEDMPLMNETMKRKKTLEDVEDIESEDNLTQCEYKTKDPEKKKKPEEKTEPKEIAVDPKKLFTLETKLTHTLVPNLVTQDDDNDNNSDVDLDDQQRLTIAEAFADDDIIEEFMKEKADAEEKDKPKDINLTLPGWGEWGGSGIVPSQRKKTRFLIKAPPPPPRKDRFLGNVIISETKDKTIAKHQVNYLPFPFTSAGQFEQSIRAPIGKDWNPEMAFKKMIKPKVVTRLGTVISPLDESDVYKKNEQKYDLKFSARSKNKLKSKRKKSTKKVK